MDFAISKYDQLHRPDKEFQRPLYKQKKCILFKKVCVAPYNDSNKFIQQSCSKLHISSVIVQKKPSLCKACKTHKNPL